jgi:hypothetical protein
MTTKTQDLALLLAAFAVMPTLVGCESTSRMQPSQQQVQPSQQAMAPLPQHTHLAYTGRVTSRIPVQGTVGTSWSSTIAVPIGGIFLPLDIRSSNNDGTLPFYQYFLVTSAPEGKRAMAAWPGFIEEGTCVDVLVTSENLGRVSLNVGEVSLRPSTSCK